MTTQDIAVWDSIVGNTVITYKTTYTNGVGSSVIINTRPKTEEDKPSEWAVKIAQIMESGSWVEDSKGNQVWTPNS